MEMKQQLFTGQSISLLPFDAGRDAEALARWSLDAPFTRLMEKGPARPLNVSQIKKQFEPKEPEHDRIGFTICTRGEERPVGYARLEGISWPTGTASLRVGIGEPAARGQGYGREALQMLLAYAFDELNLYHLAVETPAYNQHGVTILQRAGFVVETRRREAVLRNGRRWDMLHLGLLRPEWIARKEPLA